MIPNVKVAIVRAGDRATAVRQALALLSDELTMRVRPGSRVLVKPNLVSHKTQLASTHAATFGATLKALFDLGAGQIIAAEGATDAPSGFTRFGLRREAEGRAVRFFDLNREESRWEPLELTGLDGTVRVARVSKTVTDSECRVSLAMAKTHVTSILTLSLKNMLSSIHPSDRVMMHGYAGGGNGYSGWRKLVVECLFEAIEFPAGGLLRCADVLRPALV